MEKGDIRKQGKEKMKFGFQEGDSRSNGDEKKDKGGVGCSERGLKGETRNERKQLRRMYEEDNEQEGKKGMQ